MTRIELEDLNRELIEFLTAIRDKIDAKLEELSVDEDDSDELEEDEEVD